MLEGYIFNPAAQVSAPSLIQTFDTLLFCAVFLFLWRQSGVVYFRFWSLAWAIESLAILSSFAVHWSRLFLWLSALFEVAFAVSLLFAAQSAAPLMTRGRTTRTWVFVVPGLVVVDYLFLWRLPPTRFNALHAGMLAIIYAYSFFRIGVGTSMKNGIGGKMLRFALASLCLQYLGHSLVYFYAATGRPIAWLTPFRWVDVYGLIAETLLAFSAMAMWIQTQEDSIGQLRSELDLIGKSRAGTFELDHLTGLLNRQALQTHMEQNFEGVVAVCDLDYFKEINDRFGHLVGDEVLRSVGHLIRKSIRVEDEAFRWGGDEFVVLFRNQQLNIAQARMAALEVRLTAYRIRGYGMFPLGLSWGASEGAGRPLQPALEEADLQMYQYKRRAHAKDP